MATTLSAMGSMNLSQYNQCIDSSELDNWVDFNAMPSPTPASSSKLSMSRSVSSMTSPTNSLLPLDQSEDHQTPVQPSHEYDRWKQQTGIPMGSIASLTSLRESSSGSQAQMGSFNSGLDEYSLSGFDMGSGMDMDIAPASALPAFFYPPGDRPSQVDNFIDPSAIAAPEEPQNPVRFYPGMHQQAALAKAQAQAQQQRQQQMLQQQQKHQRRASEQQSHSQSSRRSSSQQGRDPRTEETIARVVNQIRQNSSLSADNKSSNNSVLPHIIRSKKDEDDMDEDERMLASEEGKKLSSKERRQLRNKVSARAFRSRRKEYISQLEGEVASKINECNELKASNRALMEENLRSRAFIERLLRHPAFKPFLEDLSRDPSLTMAVTDLQAQIPSVGAPSMPQHKDITSYPGPAQQFHEAPKVENTTHVGMTMIPETPLDMSMLNLGPSNWAVPNMGFGYHQPRVFAVLEVPEGPAAPLELGSLSGKDESSLPTLSPGEESKVDYPTLEQPDEVADVATPSVDEDAANIDTVELSPIDKDDPAFALYVDSPVHFTPSECTKSEGRKPTVAEIVPGKSSNYFELLVCDESSAADSQKQTEQLEKMCAKLDVLCERIGVFTSHLRL